jgi:hypothetical protein
MSEVDKAEPVNRWSISYRAKNLADVLGKNICCSRARAYLSAGFSTVLPRLVPRPAKRCSGSKKGFEVLEARRRWGRKLDDIFMN